MQWQQQENQLLTKQKFNKEGISGPKKEKYGEVDEEKFINEHWKQEFPVTRKMTQNKASEVI